MRAIRTSSLLIACLLLVACRGEGERRSEPGAATTSATSTTAGATSGSQRAPSAPASSWALASASAAPSASVAPSSAPLPTEPLARADFAAMKLGTTLKSKLRDALDVGGTVGAVDVCSSEAQNVVAEVRKETGVTVGRASVRLRNPKDAPPEWVAAWLKAQGTRGVGGVTGVREIVDTKQGKVAHVLRPIGIESACLGCHGDPATILPGVKAVLASKYPGDAATGYKTGDLRGALWAEYAVAP